MMGSVVRIRRGPESWIESPDQEAKEGPLAQKSYGQVKLLSLTGWW